MSSNGQLWSVESAAPLLSTPVAEWFAVHTYPRHEKVVADRIQQQGLTTFLPMTTEVHRWSDRRKTVHLPLFSCYVFVQIVPTNEKRLRVLQTDGVISLVGTTRVGTPIPDEQIEGVRALLDEGVPCTTHPFLKIGQRVRVRSGALNGVEGVLVSQNGNDSLVISVEAIQRSLAVKINGYDLDVIE
jgi:transcription termination/antitermination protein NusG